MYPHLKRFLPHRAAVVTTALCYALLLMLIFTFWRTGLDEFRYLRV